MGTAIQRDLEEVFSGDLCGGGQSCIPKLQNSYKNGIAGALSSIYSLTNQLENLLLVDDLHYNMTLKISVYNEENFQIFVFYAFSILQQSFEKMNQLCIKGTMNAIQSAKNIIFNYLIIGGVLLELLFLVFFVFYKRYISHQMKITQLLITWIPNYKFQEQIVQATLKDLSLR